MAEPIARSLVCSIAMHDKCDGHAPNGNPANGLCGCFCHTDVTAPYLPPADRP